MPIELTAAAKFQMQQQRASLGPVQNTGYSQYGASRMRDSMRGWTWWGGSADDDIGANLSVLQQRGRDLYMGAPLARGAIDTLVLEVIGPGLKMKPAFDSKFLKLSETQTEEKREEIQREFHHWAESDQFECDYERSKSFAESQGLAFLSAMVSGDNFTLMPIVPRKHSLYDLRLQLIEADRVTNPGMFPMSAFAQQVRLLDNGGFISQGVEVGLDGAVEAYHVAQWHPLSQQAVRHIGDWRRVPAFGAKTGRKNIIHLMPFERPEQRRGVSMLAPVIEQLKQLARYSDAELMAAVVSAFFTVFIKSQTPEIPLGQAIAPELMMPGGRGMDGGIPTTSQAMPPVRDNSFQLGNGNILGLNPDESVEFANPNRPNTAFDGFVSSVLKQIGVGLGIPYEVLLKHFSASYSASRAAMLQFWKLVTTRRQWFARRWCQPIYNEWLCEAVLKGRLDLPGFLDDPIIREAWSLAEWHGPSQGQIDPLKEALASRLKIDQNLSTLDREATEINGSDWQQNMRQRAQEVKLRSSLGLDEAELLDQAAQPNTKSSLTNDVLMRIALNLLHEEQAA